VMHANEVVPMQVEPVAAMGVSPLAAMMASDPALASVDAVSEAEQQQVDSERALGDRQLLAFVVDKVAGGAHAFKANKLPQILASLVREEYMPAALSATKKALDPNLRGHIEVGAFVEWWPHTRFATSQYENAWMKELNMEAMRTQLMSEVLQKQVEQEAAQAAAEAAAAQAAKDKQQRLASQPKRIQMVLGRLRKAEAAVQDAHSLALREALVAVEELADVSPNFLQQLRDQLEEASPIMARARGAPFTQLIHHKARTLSLVKEVEASAHAEREAREAGVSAIAAYAYRAEGMHRRLHNRSAAQTAEWLRVGFRRTSEAGRKQEAKHLVDNETKKVKAALESMTAWLDTTGRSRVESLRSRFDSLAERTLQRVAAGQMAQVGGHQRHRTSLCAELAAQIARQLDATHEREGAELQASLDELSKELQPREAMPMDEHCQLLCSELWFKQRQNLATLQAAEHAAVPTMVKVFVETLAGPSPTEDAALGAMRVSASELSGAATFATMLHGQLSLEQNLDALHGATRDVRQAVSTLSTAMGQYAQSGAAHPPEGVRAQLSQLWRFVLELERQASSVKTAVGGAVRVTAVHLQGFEGRELPRAQAMLDAGATVAKAASAIVNIMRGDTPVKRGGAAADLSTDEAGRDEVHPDLGGLAERWGPAVVAMQAEQQRLVAAAEDMEQHSLDMQGLVLEVSERVEGVMARFHALVEPAAKPLRHAANLAELKAACDAFELASVTLRERATKSIELPKLFARLQGQLQQQQDSMNAWCYPLIKLKQELVDTSEELKGGDKIVGVGRVSKAATKTSQEATASRRGACTGQGAQREALARQGTPSDAGQAAERRWRFNDGCAGGSRADLEAAATALAAAQGGTARHLGEESAFTRLVDGDARHARPDEITARVRRGEDLEDPWARRDRQAHVDDGRALRQAPPRAAARAGRGGRSRAAPRALAPV